eukprot:5371689-Amphidinium_carterae.1
MLLAEPHLALQAGKDTASLVYHGGCQPIKSGVDAFFLDRYMSLPFKLMDSLEHISISTKFVVRAKRANHTASV